MPKVRRNARAKATGCAPTSCAISAIGIRSGIDDSMIDAAARAAISIVSSDAPRGTQSPESRYKDAAEEPAVNLRAIFHPVTVSAAGLIWGRLQPA
jgi:hypothetical protein